MATTQDMFDQFLNPQTPVDQKKAELLIASEQKKAELAGLSPADAYQVGASAMTGLGQDAMATQEQADLINLAPVDIIAKYGQERGTALLASKYQGIDAYGRDTQSTRDPGQLAGDLLNQTLTGFGNAVGGVGALGVGLINDEGGAIVSETLDRFSQGMEDLRSDASKRRSQAMGARSDLRQQDSQAQYQEDIANGDSSVVAGLARFGRDFGGGVVDVATDPTVAADMAAQGVGSMAAIPLIAAAGTAAAPAALAGTGARVAAQVLGANRKAVQVGRMIEGALAPTLAIGAVESGSTYQQTVNQINAMPFSELARTSPKFIELVASGMSESQARTELANSAALQAAGTQLPAAILAGSLVSKFEAAPAAARSVKGALQNAGKEFIEEGSQSGTSQLAINTALASQVDPNTDVLAGVGTQAGQGAVAGLATTAAIQTPGVIAKTAQDTATAAIGAVNKQVDGLRAKNEAASPVADAKVQEAAVSAAAAAPTVQEAVAADETLDPAKKAELDTLVTDITESAINLNGDELAADATLPPVIQSAAKGQTTQVGFLQALAKASNDESLTDADRVTALVTMQQLVGGLNTYLDEVGSGLTDLDEAHPVRQFVSSIQKMNAALNASPSVSKAQEQSEPLVQRAVDAAPLTEQTANDQSVSIHLAAAEVAPGTTTQEGVNTLLKMASTGKLTLTDAQRTNLEMLAKLHQNAKEYDDVLAGLDQTPQNRVSQEIKTGTSGVDDGLSVVQHAQGIRQALVRGDTEDAKARLEDLGLFAQHMQNKVNAINTHMQTDNPNSKNAVSYQKLVGTRGNRQFVDSGRSKQGVTPTSETSIRHAQLVNAEANFVTKSFNTLAETFPDLGIKPMAFSELDTRLQGKPAQVAESFASGSAKAGSTALAKPAQAKSEPAKAAKPVEQQAAPAQPAAPAVTEEFKATLSKAVKGMDDATITRRINALMSDLINEDSPRKLLALDMLTAERDSRAQLSEPVEPVVAPEPVPAAPVTEPVQAAAPAPEVAPVATEEVVADDVGSTNPMVDRYPMLIGGESNTFNTTFKIPMTPISNLDGSRTPIRDVVSGLEATVPDASAVRAFKHILTDFPNVHGYLNMRLGDFMSKKPKALGGKTIRQATLDGDINPVVYPNGRSAAIAEFDGNEFVMNTELTAKAYLAGVNWLLNGMSFVSAYDVERAAKVLGIAEDEVTDAHMDALANGVTRLQAIDALANNIQRYWGVTGDSSVIDGYVKGIPQSVAANIIDAMLNQTFPMQNEQGQVVDTPVLVQTKLDISTDTEVRDLDVFTPVSFRDTPLANYRAAIDKLVAAQPELVVYMGEFVPPVAGTQLNNSAVQNTPEQKEMIKNQNATGYTLNTQTLGAYEAMGIDAILDLFGEGKLDEATTNRNDLVAREGRNVNIIAAWETAKETVFSVRAQAEEDGVAVDQVQVHYAHNITSVGRAQQLGRYTPQSSKLMRTLFLPTNSKPMNLTDTTGQDYRAFMLGLGQSLGVKVHNFDPAVTEQKVMDLVNGKLAPVIEVLRDHLANNARPFSTTELAMFKSVLGKPTFESFQGMMEYARFLNTEDKSNYVTQLYLEADGMSNGPFNSMALFTTTAFNEDQLANLAKCGLYIGGAAAAQTSWVKRTEDPVDLYETVSTRTKQAVANLRKDVEFQATHAKDKSLKQQAANMLVMQDHLNRMMDLLLDDVTLVEHANGTTEIETKRGISKNPTTITTYGSGKAGIAAKLTNAMLDNLYRRISDAIAAHAADSSLSAAQAMFPNDPAADSKLATLDAAMQALTTNYVGVFKNNFVVRSSGNKGEQVSVTTDYTIGRESFKTLARNVKAMFVEPMHSAIQETLDPSVGDATDSLRKLTQVQSIVLANAYARRVNEVLPKKGSPDYVLGGYLSQQQQREVFQSLAPLNPLIKANGQTFFIAGSEKVGLAGETAYGSSFNDNIRTAPTVYAPANAGVKGIATMVIGTGDGKTIQLVSQDPTNTERAVFIFDGINYPLDFIQQGSEAANKAAYQAILGNPMQAVSETFDSFLAAVDGKLENWVDVTPEFKLQMAQAMFGLDVTQEEADQMDVESINLYMHGVAAEARRHALSIQARHNVLAQVNLGMDQMAAAGSPYLVTDKLQLTGTKQEIADQLNQLYAAELEKLTAAAIEEDRAANNAAREANQGIQSQLLEAGKPHETGVRIITGNDLTGLVDSLKGVVPRNQVLALVEGVKNAVKDGYKVVYGSHTALADYNASLGANGIDMTTIDPVTDRGVTIPNKQEIWLLDPSSEVLAHEIIHASTFKSVLGHFQAKYGNEPAVVSADVANSVDKIEELMLQFLGALTLKETEAYRSAVEAITAALNNTELTEAERAATAVNEYMAWGLANVELAKAQSTVTSRVAGIVMDTIRTIRNWLFGTGGKDTNDMLSNLAFHTKVVMNSTQPSLQTMAADTALMQSAVYGKDERLADLDRLFNKKVTAFVKTGTPVEQARAKRVTTQAAINADHIRGLFAANGFPMTMQESSTFFKIVAALGTQATIDPNIMNRMQELYSAATKDMTVETFMDDPTGNNPADYARALQRFDVVMGKKGIGRDAMGRSTLLPSFMALALTNDRFRSVLAQMEVPRTLPSDQERAFDRLLENQTNKMLDQLSDVLTGQKRATNINQAIDNLADQLVNIEQQREGFYDQFVTPLGSYSDRANQLIVDGMNRLSSKFVSLAESRRQAGKDQRVLDQAVNNGLELAASVINEERAGLMGEAILAGANATNMSKWIHDLIADVVGRVDSNANLYDMIKKVRSTIQRVRNQFRTELPKTLAKQFTRALSNDEWAMLHSAIGKTDLTSVVENGSFTRDQVTAMFGNQTELNKAVRSLEDDIKSLDRKYATEYLHKAQQLAGFMMNGVAGQNLQRNAWAIALRLGTRTAQIDANPALVSKIDSLVSLYAFDMLTDSAKEAMGKLVAEQKAGVDFTFGYAQGLRNDELARVDDSVTGQAKMNQYKGHMPLLAQDGVSLIIADDREYAKLAERSYVRVADYATSNLDGTNARMGYYFAPVSGRSAFNQGILQNVRQTVGGVDSITGYTVGGVMGGRITDPKQVSRIAAMQAAGRYIENGSNLLPVFNSQGKVVAYERSADPVQVASLNFNQHFGDVMGAWKGRLAEEMLAVESNTVAIEQMGEMFRKDMAKSSANKAQYMNLFDMATQRKYPVLLDALKLFTPSTVDMIHATFPNNEFWVRKDMLDNVIGYRSATVGDAWTGNTYWSPQTQEAVRKLAMTVFGNKAFQYLVQAESKAQDIVQDAKTLIIVKSVIVPVANFMSNILQLVARGVPVRSIVAGLPKKLAETRQYVAAEKRAIEAEAELHATTDPAKQRRLRVEIQSIRDSYKRMSIWPLIQRGELSSMSDDAQPEDVELSSGRLSQYIEAQVNKLPPALRAAGKYALITKDTAIYKGLRKSVEYGDFLAKAILWDDLTQRQGKDEAYATGRVTEEFVNFDRLGGRNRQYLENMGLLWFYNFKIRSAKVGLSILRNNPFHALMAAVTPTPAFLGSVGSPITDNVFSQIAEGSLGHSMGLDQLFSAPMMHPIENMLF